MDGVAIHLRQRFNNGNDLPSRLHDLIRNDKSNVSGTNHDKLLPGKHAVDVHHRLCGTRSHHAWKIPAGKCQRFFACTCSDQDLVRLYRMRLIIADDAQLVVREEPVYNGIELNFDTCIKTFLKQFFAEMISTHACSVMAGAKELMDLLKKLATRTVVLIKYRYFAAC